ncbi:MAG: translation initiation factor IF-3 [Dehalococcoidia bacterium]|jgi:translation initiation factor IF-3|nr:translation initiation factor IF-3 [Dehalococcoidia bacterium]
MMKPNPRGNTRSDRFLPVNRQIRAREVRVITEEGEQLGTMPVPKALQLAQERELDLVMVAPNVVPPVCRLLDYGKYKYEQIKKDKRVNKGQKGLLREVRLRPKIEEHDLQDKIRKTRELLAEGNKVKITVRFRGREIVYPELGWQVLKRVAEALKDEAVASSQPSKDARNIALTLAPTPTAVKKTQEAKQDAKAEDTQGSEKPVPGDGNGQAHAGEVRQEPLSAP